MGPFESADRHQGGSPTNTEPRRLVSYAFYADAGSYDFYAHTQMPVQTPFFWRITGGAWQYFNTGFGDGRWTSLATNLSLSGEHLLEINHRERSSVSDKFVCTRRDTSTRWHQPTTRPRQ